MNKYVLVDGKPYLFADGRAYGVRKNKDGFTVGKAVELPEIPTRTYSELSINAKFQNGYDTIEDTDDTPEEAEAFEAVSEEALDEAMGLTADADDIVIVRDGKDIVVPDEGPVFEPDGMTVAELREYAKDHGIELNGARVRAEIIEAIDKAHKDKTTV